MNTTIRTAKFYHLNIRTVSWHKGHEEQASIALLELRRMKDHFPDSIAWTKRLSFVPGRFVTRRDGSRTGRDRAVHSARRKAVTVAVGEGFFPGPLTLGGEFVDGSRLGVLRHEFGHRLHATFEMGTEGKDWIDAINCKSVKGKLGKTVSQYAVRHDQEVYRETFAEAFCAVTHPDYVDEMLPDEIEGFVLERLWKARMAAR